VVFGPTEKKKNTAIKKVLEGPRALARGGVQYSAKSTGKGNIYTAKKVTANTIIMTERGPGQGGNVKKGGDLKKKGGH